MTVADWIFDGIGIGGVVLFLLAYYWLQAEKVTPGDLRYLLLNLFGALLVMISLLWRWNFSAFVLEAVWMLISIYGIVKWARKRRGNVE